MTEPMRPDWVVCGTPWTNGQVAIFASTKLDQATLESKRDSLARHDPFDPYEPLEFTRWRHALTVEMRTFVIVVANTYEQALRSLFEQWSPKQATHPAELSDADGRRAI